MGHANCASIISPGKKWSDRKFVRSAREKTVTTIRFLSVFEGILISFHSGVSVASHFSGLSAGECLPPPHSAFASLRWLRSPPLLNRRNDKATSPISLPENRIPPRTQTIFYSRNLFQKTDTAARISGHIFFRKAICWSNFHSFRRDPNIWNWLEIGCRSNSDSANSKDGSRYLCKYHIACRKMIWPEIQRE